MAVSRRDFVLSSAALLPVVMVEGQTSPPVRYQSILAKAAFTDEQKADLLRMVSDSEKGLAILRAYPLENGHDPATPFKIWRKDRA
jgi:hypothetical protein